MKTKSYPQKILNNDVNASSHWDMCSWSRFRMIDTTYVMTAKISLYLTHTPTPCSLAQASSSRQFHKRKKKRKRIGQTQPWSRVTRTSSAKRVLYHQTTTLFPPTSACRVTDSYRQLDPDLTHLPGLFIAFVSSSNVIKPRFNPSFSSQFRQPPTQYQFNANP